MIERHGRHGFFASTLLPHGPHEPHGADDEPGPHVMHGPGTQPTCSAFRKPRPGGSCHGTSMSGG